MRKSAGVFPRTSHGGGEVEADDGFWVAWQGEKRASARGRSGGEVQRDAWMPAQAGGGRGGGPEQRAALRR